MRVQPPDPGCGVIVAYRCHLAVPLFVALDVLDLRFIQDADLTSGQKAVLIGSGLWLAAGIGALHLFRDRARFLRVIRGPLLSCYTLLFALAAGESIVRIAKPSGPMLRSPNEVLEYEPASLGVTGITGRKRFTTNSLGLRGPELPQEQNLYRIIAIGGSTTECFALDDSEEWTHLLMEKLAQGQQRRSVWVANAGMASHNTVSHLALLRTLPIFKRAELLIFLVGLNDLLATAAFEGAPTQATFEQYAVDLMNQLLAQAPGSTRPYYTRLRLYTVARAATTKRTITLGDLRLLRKRRAEGRIVPLPNIQIGLEEYHTRLERLADECRALTARCLFLTQPTLWHSDLSAAEEATLTDGYVGRFEANKGYVSVADLEMAMNAYNGMLLRTCREAELECFDLAAAIPKSNVIFYDDSHYTEAGARLVAERLAEYLLSHPPFGDGL